MDTCHPELGMNMRMTGVVVILLGLCAAMTSAQDVVIYRDTGLLVTYDDGSTEDLIVKYRGYVSSNRRQTGSHSSWLHPIDTRQCHWSVSGYISRDICTLSRSLGEQCVGDLSTIYHNDLSSSGESFGLNNWQGENCGKAAPKINKDIESIRSSIVQSFNTVVDGDIDPLLDSLKANIRGQITVK